MVQPLISHLDFPLDFVQLLAQHLAQIVPKSELKDELVVALWRVSTER